MRKTFRLAVLAMSLVQAMSGSSLAQALDAVANAQAASERQDYVEMLRWYRMGTAQGNAEAQYHLAAEYDLGFRVGEDAAEALSLV